MLVSLITRFRTLHFRVRSGLRIRWLRLLGAQVGRGVALHCGAEISLRHPVIGLGQIAIGDGCELSRHVTLHPYSGSIRLGSRVFLGPYVVIYGHGGVEIGECSLIAMHCRILSSNHAIPPIGIDIGSQPDELRPTKIGRDVWLGAGVTVLGGVTIGDGCIVGAGAVVTKDLPPYTVAVGIPARVTGQRPLKS